MAQKALAGQAQRIERWTQVLCNGQQQTGALRCKVVGFGGRPLRRYARGRGTGHAGSAWQLAREQRQPIRRFLFAREHRTSLFAVTVYFKDHVRQYGRLRPVSGTAKNRHCSKPACTRPYYRGSIFSKPCGRIPTAASPLQSAPNIRTFEGKFTALFSKIVPRGYIDRKTSNLPCAMNQKLVGMRKMISPIHPDELEKHFHSF